MRNSLFIAILAVVVLPSCSSLSPIPYSSMSTELRSVIDEHSSAKKVLLEAKSGALPNSGFRLHYVPTMRESGPRSTFRMPFPDEIQLPMITMVEGQQKWDQFILLIFELHNTRSKSSFDRLWKEARQGTISREQFASQVIKVEFEAVKSTKKILQSLPMSDSEKVGSYAYYRLARCPDDYEDFEAYVRRVSPQRKQAEEYHRIYDGLRGTKPQVISLFNSPTDHTPNTMQSGEQDVTSNPDKRLEFSE